MTPARLSALDAAFLAIESDAAPMHVGWAALFQPPADGPLPEFDAIRAHVERRLHRAPRYRQRLAHVPLGLDDPVWVDDPRFDIARHVCRSDHADFGQLVDEVMSTALDHDCALWELWIADSLQDGSIGVVGKAHHCLVDGLAAVELMALLLDAEPAPEPDGDDGGGWMPRPAPNPVKLVSDAVGNQFVKAASIARVPLHWLRDPLSLLDVPGQAWRVAQAVVHTAQPLARPSRLNGAMPAARHLAMVSRPFEDLRIIKRRFDATINDVLLSASAGGLRGLLEERAEPLDDVKAMVPVSVQALDEQWGNRIVFMFLPLPCGEADPVWRLRDIHVAMRERRREGEPQGADTLFNAIAYAPPPVRRMASKLLASPRLSNLTISNIPGPNAPLYLMGCEVQRAYPIVPLTGGHGISIGMTTVNGRACFGIYAQAELTDDAERIARGIDEAIDELLERAAAA
ncbi:MAG: wax ester/triacylglycerol synthase family O-acyltransferase [Solirubrobacteraceae bacterium]